MTLVLFMIMFKTKSLLSFKLKVFDVSNFVCIASAFCCLVVSENNSMKYFLIFLFIEFTHIV